MGQWGNTKARQVGVLFLFAVTLSAHDIPVDVLVQTFFKPAGSTLHLLMRVPLSAMRDVNFPLHGQGYLDLPQPDSLLREAARTWLANAIVVEENGQALPAPAIAAVRLSIPSDRSFTSYDAALAHIHGPPMPAATELIWNQAMLDVELQYPIASDRSDFAIRPELARLGLRVVTTMRFLPPGGAVRAFEWTGDPGLVRLDPRWHHAAWQFVQLGFRHILDGTDHLLFLLCLVIPFRRFRQLVLIVTAFTVAHSITLLASALQVAPAALWFPPLVEVLIAVSILYMALENIVLAAPAATPGEERESSSAAAGTRGGGAPRATKKDDRRSIRRRLLLAFAFGLVHGFGFSFALRETLQFAGSHLLTSLLSFNVGIELGQLLVLIVLIPVLQVTFRYVMAERIGTIILSALVAHTAWHWMTERFDRLRQFTWPGVDAVTLLWTLRLLMGTVLVAGILWVTRRFHVPKVLKGPEGPDGP